MLSELFQPVLDQMSGVMHKSMGVINSTSILVSYVGEPANDADTFSIASVAQANGKPFICNGYSCVGIGTKTLLSILFMLRELILKSKSFAPCFLSLFPIFTFTVLTSTIK